MKTIDSIVSYKIPQNIHAPEHLKSNPAIKPVPTLNLKAADVSQIYPDQYGGRHGINGFTTDLRHQVDDDLDIEELEEKRWAQVNPIFKKLWTYKTIKEKECQFQKNRFATIKGTLVQNLDVNYIKDANKNYAERLETKLNEHRESSLGKTLLNQSVMERLHGKGDNYNTLSNTLNMRDNSIGKENERCRNNSLG